MYCYYYFYRSDLEEIAVQVALPMFFTLSFYALLWLYKAAEILVIDIFDDLQVDSRKDSVNR